MGAGVEGMAATLQDAWFVEERVCLPEFPAPGMSAAELATLLESVEVADLSDVDVVGAVQGWAQVIAAATAAQAAVVRELAERNRWMSERFVPNEIACALVCTRRAAENLFYRAVLLGHHPALGDALAGGRLDVRKVDVIIEALALCPPHAYDAMLARAIEAAQDRTAPELARFVRAAVLAAFPKDAEERLVEAREQRCVLLEPMIDAMAWVHAFLPADDAVAMFTVIDAMAGTVRVAGDDRTADQRRADVVSDLFTGILRAQQLPDGAPLPRRHGQAAQLNVTVAASTLLGLDDQPGHLGSFGPIPASMARDLAQDATWRRVVTDPTTGQVREVGSVGYRPGADLTRTVIVRDGTCTFPGCRQPGHRCDLDHRDPFDPHRPAYEQTCAENLHCLCRHHHQAKTKGHWKVGHDPTTGTTWWTSPMGITHARHARPPLTPTPPEPPDPDPDPPPF